MIARLLAFALTAALTGCPSPSSQPDADPDCEFELEWGRLEQGTFAPFMSGESAEITLGFQGFRYISSILQVSRSTADSISIQFQIDVDGHDSYVQAPDSVAVSSGPGNARYAENILVFFNDIPMPELLGRDALVIAQGVADGCTGRYQTTVTLVDEENCLETADGGLICQEDSADAGL